ncbi:uncharacterized protein [Hemitrygon akajei]|uniref:uncharacterized protein n=1 Tax=Hemitrygon akajei TaxID=2704970 RepID=UPI003BFA1070
MGSERPARRDRSDSSIWLICVLTATLIITGICWRIHVSQIRQPKVTSDQNSTLQSKLSALNSNLSDLKRMHSDLRHQFTEMETKYRSVNETKAQICELLTSRREQTCSEDWIRKKGRCYYVSTFETTFPRAVQECSKRHSRLLEINSRDEASFVFGFLVRNVRYRIGKCETGEAASSLMYKNDNGRSVCGTCHSFSWRNLCNGQYRFICDKSARWCTGIPENIKDLCQQPPGPT